MAAHDEDAVAEKARLMSLDSTDKSADLTSEQREPSSMLESLKDEEGAVHLAEAQRPSTLGLWVVVNVTSTVAIVFINKAIFASEHFNNAQFLFASYHFTLTFILLTLLSSSNPLLVGFKQFERRSVSIKAIFPLAASMSLSVIFLNTSLAFCSVPFYQTVRVLLTPMVAIIDYFFFHKSIPRQAAWMLLPACAGVALLAYSDTKNAKKGSQGTTPFGAAFALTGVVISSVYTVWIKVYHQKLDLNSSQLLFAQSPVGAAMLAVLGVSSGKIPELSGFDRQMWLYVFLSGLCATLLNLSQFKIIALAGPVTGTVVGHVKTICIVLIGWIIASKAVSTGSIAGIVIAIAGIVAYSYFERRYRQIPSA